jgi:hypothetical protein
MTRRALLVAAAAAAAVLAVGAAAPAPAPAAAPKTTTACVLTLTIDPKQSPFTLVGSVSKPFNATVTPVKATATGNLYLRLPADAATSATAAGPCPPAALWADADAAADLLSRAQLVQPQGKPGVDLLPDKIAAKVLSNESGDQIATYTLTDFAFGLEGNGPLGGVTAAPAAASPAAVDASAGGTTDAEVVVLKGGLVIDSMLTGERTADLEQVAQNVTFASGAAPIGSGASTSSALGVKLEDVKWSLAVSPKTTPGILLTEAKVGIEGTIVASAGALAKAAAPMPATALRLRCTPRALGPVIEGGDELKADLVKRQKRVSGGCPDGAGGGGAVKAAPAGEEEEAEGEVAAATAASGEGGLSDVDRAVLEAYGSGAPSALLLPPSSSAPVAVAALLAAAALLA